MCQFCVGSRVLCTGCIEELGGSTWVDGPMLSVSHLWEKVAS
jgi:hypothetical protein